MDERCVELEIPTSRNFVIWLGNKIKNRRFELQKQRCQDISSYTISTTAISAALIIK